MARKGYIIHDQQAVYYLTFTVVGWIDIFTRQSYRDIVIESFKYCQQKKGLHLHAFVIMSNHVHLIVSVDAGFTISGFVRDCKKFTSNKITEAIENSGVENRRDWMLHQFKYYASLHARNEKYQLWEHDNHPIEPAVRSFQLRTTIPGDCVSTCIVYTGFPFILHIRHEPLPAFCPAQRARMWRRKKKLVGIYI